jgi:hypothetical protein
MTTDKARALLDSRERQHRIEELRRLLETYQHNPNFSQSCMGWRRELSDLRVEQETFVHEAPVKDLPWPQAKAHAIAALNRQRVISPATPQDRVVAVRAAYYSSLGLVSRLAARGETAARR